MCSASVAASVSPSASSSTSFMDYGSANTADHLCEPGVPGRAIVWMAIDEVRRRLSSEVRRMSAGEVRRSSGREVRRRSVRFFGALGGALSDPAGIAHANRIVKRRVLHTTERNPSYFRRVCSKTQAKYSESKGFKTDDVISFERELRKRHYLGGVKTPNKI